MCLPSSRTFLYVRDYYCYYFRVTFVLGRKEDSLTVRKKKFYHETRLLPHPWTEGVCDYHSNPYVTPLKNSINRSHRHVHHGVCLGDTWRSHCSRTQKRAVERDSLGGNTGLPSRLFNDDGPSCKVRDCSVHESVGCRHKE